MSKKKKHSSDPEMDALDAELDAEMAAYEAMLDAEEAAQGGGEADEPGDAGEGGEEDGGLSGGSLSGDGGGLADEGVLSEDELADEDDLADEDELADDELDGEGGDGGDGLPGNIHPATYTGPFKSGFVAVVGRPNAGKSTLINAIVGDKVLITSPTAQTTRHRISAIYNEPDMQIVLVDTPGLHKPVDALGEELNISALNALKDVDVVAMLVDGSQEAGRGDEWVARHVAEAKAKKVLVVTKADIIDQSAARAQIERMGKFCAFDDVVVLSAKEGFNVDGFLRVVAGYLPEGPRWFPTDMKTDQRIEVIIAEFIREKVLLNTRDEVPHSVGVTVDETRYNEKKDLSTIKATIYVEREGQKGIVIGAGGKMIKRIGSQARHDLQRILGNQVLLQLNVKVKEGWRSDAAQIKRFGYGEGA